MGSMWKYVEKEKEWDDIWMMQGGGRYAHQERMLLMLVVYL